MDRIYWLTTKDFDAAGVFYPDDKRNTIIRLIVLSFAAVSIFVLLLGSGLIIMYFQDLFS